MDYDQECKGDVVAISNPLKAAHRESKYANLAEDDGLAARPRTERRAPGDPAHFRLSMEEP
ncbi:hypothetical protein [Paraburkholderia guartelaensis]|uniref:hypothetical protein n=1 Tax=Paraburkholderia guartelaensis TaxID=2546446 RepID=UPI002AB7E2D3|nr:hypothetical protein [Paraburkholderia guartelaensis]